MNRVFFWLKNTVIGSRRGIEDVIVSMVPQVFALMAGVVTSILTARGLGPEGMGKYALILSVSGIAVSLSDLGIGQTAIRFASRAVSQGDQEGQFSVLRWAFRLRIILVSIVSALAFFIVPYVATSLWHAKELTPLARLSLLGGIIGAFAAVPTIYFQSLKKFKMNAAVSIGQTFVSLAGILIIAWLSDWSIKVLIEISIFAAIIGSTAFISMVPRRTIIDLSELKLMLKGKRESFWRQPQAGLEQEGAGINSFAFYMILSTVLVTLTTRMDVWMMGFFLDKQQIGMYSVASRFTLPLIVLLGALNTALWPRASALTNYQEIAALLRKTFLISVIVAACAVVYSLFFPLLTPWLFGQDYSGAIILGQILSIRYCLAILVCPIGVIGYSFGMVREYWWINLVQFITVIIVNLLLLPRLGALGSGVALIFNELVGFAFVAFTVRKKISVIEGA